MGRRGDAREAEKFIGELKRKFFTIVDDQTGQVEGYFRLHENKRSMLGGGWLAMFQSALRQLAQENLTADQCHVLFFLLSQLDFSNFIRIGQREVSETLGMRQPHVSRAIKGLIDKNILTEGPRAGLHKTYRLNPYYGHKGKNVQQTIVQYDELRKAREAKQPHT